MSGHSGFRGMSWTSWRWVTLCCRLLVIVRSLRLVILVFKECPELHREGLLFIVGCWLLCNHYVWSHWFSLCLTWTAVVSPIWSHACCLMRSVWLVTMVSLAVSYNAKDILFRERKKKICTFLQFGDFLSIWCSVFLLAEKRIALSWIILKQYCKNLVDRCARETLWFIVYFPQP